MKAKIYLSILLALFTLSASAQKMSKRTTKHHMDSVWKYVNSLKLATLDSIIDYADRKKNEVSEQDDIQILNDTTSNGAVMEMIVIDGDTSYIYNMSTFAVVDLKPYGNEEKDRMFRKLRFHVKKVYPYAKIAADKLMMYNEQIANVKSEHKKKKLMKLREKALKEEFEDVIKNMSKTSGRVLIKLIDRETGQSTYEIIKEMRGTIKAWTYQGLGKLYGADLKQKFDPKNNEEDEMIERVVQSLIAEGALFY
ncbi:MAG: DUF4294 domain-containing protein [Flavobacteriales bacterium]|nr:DUF4294 domain-containing protein [Flavobacteriales bacterium]